MQPTDDGALLRQYINLVYSVALRRAGNPHHAEEIAQAVFLILAKKAGSLRHEKALSSWLFQAARLTANNLARSEARRHRREQEAHMQSVLNEPGDDTWQRIAPLLDSAVAGLAEKDRHAIVLRFYQGRSLREVGAALGASEDASAKRVERALDKLRKYFSRHGVTSTTSALALALSANSVHAAPAGLAASVSIAAAAKGATAGGSTLTLIKSTLKIMAWTKAKTALIATAVVLLAAGATTTAVIQYREHLPQTVTEYYPRESWALVGYATPESGFVSAIWSLSQTNLESFRASITPDGFFAHDAQYQAEDTFAAKAHRAIDGLTALRIIRKEMLAPDRVLLTAQPEGKYAGGKVMGPGDANVFLMVRINGDWKLDSVANNNPKGVERLRTGDQRHPAPIAVFAGYATPKDAFQSAFAAMLNADPKMFLDSLTPEYHDRFLTNEATGKSDREIAALIHQEHGPGPVQTTHDTISDTEVIFHIRGLRSGPKNLTLRKIGNEWKLDDLN